VVITQQQAGQWMALSFARSNGQADVIGSRAATFLPAQDALVAIMQDRLVSVPPALEHVLRQVGKAAPAGHDHFTSRDDSGHVHKIQI
jgi:hypothetical protein